MNILRINYRFLLISCTLLVISCAKSPVYESIYDPDTLSFDELDASFHKSSQIYYTVTNDEEYLYFTFETHHRPSQIKSIRNGIRLYFDISGKKNKDISILYPYRDPAMIRTQMETRRQGAGRPSMDEGGIEQMLGLALEAEWISGEKKEVINVGVDQEIQAGIIFDEHRRLLYRLKVPMAKLNYRSEEGPLAVGVELSGLSMNNPLGGGRGGMRPGGGMGRPTGAGRGMGRGGMRGGRMPGGSVSGMNRNMQELTADQLFWFKVKLAK